MGSKANWTQMAHPSWIWAISSALPMLGIQKMNNILWTIFTWILMIAALVGVILNIKKIRACFFIWAITNFFWMIVDFYKEIYAQSALFAVYFLLALWGIYEWKR